MKCMAQDLAVLLAAANAGDKHLYPLIYPIQLTALLLFLQFGLQHYGVFYLLSHYILGHWLTKSCPLPLTVRHPPQTPSLFALSL